MNHVASDDSSPTGEPPASKLTGPGSAAGADGSGSSAPGSSTPQRGSTGSSFSRPALVSFGSAQTQLLPSEPAEGSARSLIEVPTGDIERDPTVISQRPIAAPADFARSLSLIELARSLEGRQLHHFAVGRMIGGGGMGAVFRGRDLRLDRDVAIKVIPESRRDPETLRRFRMEAQSAARLDHPNIARVYDIGEDEAWNYIVFEFIDGINLRDLVQMDGPMSIDDAVFTTRQVAEALQHAHDRDVVHRDIKPSNVIITPTGIAKVVDMGLARNTAMDRSAADQTASGVTLGTFDYISPEQARDPRDADVRSDLYSLGCTLFYMLTGQPPFPDGTALQKLLNHGSQPPPDPRQWRDDISDQLYAVLAKLMAKRPADRYQKPLELINDLLLIAQLEGLPRSRSPGSILLRPTVAQRTLLETHLPWLVPMSVLIISAFWLQSADSLTSSLELPVPTFRAAQASAAPASTLNETTSRSTDSAASQLAPPRDAARPSSALLPSLPTTSATSQVIEPPLRAEVIEPGSGSLRSTSGTTPATGAGPVVPLAGQAPQVIDLTSEHVSASAANTLNGLRNRMSGSQTPGVSTGAGEREPASDVATAGTSALSGNAYAPASSGASPTPGAGSVAMPVESLEGHVEPRLPSPLARDTIVVSSSEPSELSSNTLWSGSLSEALARAAMIPEVRVIELRESVELNHVIAIPRSGLTLRGGPGIELVLNGEQVYGMGWESWIEVQRVAFRCQRVHFVCRNNMRQTQAVFALRAGGQLELTDCIATMDSNHGAPLGSCILVGESDPQRDVGMPLGSSAPPLSEDSAMPSFGAKSSSTLGGLSSDMPVLSDSSSSSPTGSNTIGASSLGTSGASSAPAGSSGLTSAGMPNVGQSSGGVSADAEPVSIALSGCVVRGHQNLVAMRTACRAEITLEKTCAILEGRVLTIRGLDQDRMPPVVRLSMKLSTLVCRQGFALVQTGFALRAPLTLMRKADLCAFWSPALVPHIVVDGMADQGVLDELLQLRGEENAYDQNIETLCQCRFADGKHIDFSFRDAPGEWFRERGNDNSLRWQNAVPPDRPLEEQMPEDYRLRAGMFMPGFPPSAGAPPQLDGAGQD
ncbi:MAG: protein kinase domain-containing protein [Aureliella sp.]